MYFNQEPNLNFNLIDIRNLWLLQNWNIDIHKYTIFVKIIIILEK